MSTRFNFGSRSLVGLLLALLLAPSAGLALQGNPRERPDHVWRGHFPDPDDGACPDDYHPVMDARGNVYFNPCEAALERVRVTWDVEPH